MQNYNLHLFIVKMVITNYSYAVFRSVMYTVNGFYKHHVTIVADVVPISLELSTENLVLHPSLGMPVEAGRCSHSSQSAENGYPWIPLPFTLYRYSIQI